MASGSFWSDACKYAEGRSLQTLLDATYASHGAAGSRFPASAIGSAATFNVFLDSHSFMTIFCAGCHILLERFCKRHDAVLVVALGPGISAAHLAAVRMVLWADDVRQLLRSCHVGGSNHVH